MTNPIKSLRLSLNLTQAELAEAAGMSTQAVLRYEQSLYEHPSHRLVEAIARLTHEYMPSEGTLRDVQESIIRDYELDRLSIQASAASVFSSYYPVITRGTEHPFITWRTNMIGSSSRMKFCIMLAVHPAPVGEYEKAVRPHMPSQLWRALINAGASTNQLEELDLAGANYYSRITSSSSSSSTSTLLR